MAKPQPQVVIVGSCLIDFVSYTQRCAKAGETVAAKRFVTNFGGKGANQSVAAARLGAETAIVARVGDDIWGQRYIENLKKEKVNVQYVKRVAESDTGIAQISVSEQGESQIVIIPGSNSGMCTKDVEEASSIIINAPVLALQLEIPQAVVIRAMQLCKGVKILNGAPATTEYNPDLLKLPTIFVVNEIEAETFTGLPVTTVGEAFKAAEKLMSLGCQSVIVTLGEHGSVYCNNKESYRVQSPEVECVDSTGAGDSFLGALCFMLATKKDVPMKKAIEIACAVAAESVTKPGTQCSYPDKSVLRKLKVIN